MRLVRWRQALCGHRTAHLLSSRAGANLRDIEVVNSPASGGPPPEQHVSPPQTQVYHQTVVLPAPPTTPSLLLYQPAFPLSEADYLRLTQASPFFAAVGGVLVSFGLSYVLPIVVKALDTDPKA